PAAQTSCRSPPIRTTACATARSGTRRATSSASTSSDSLFSAAPRSLCGSYDGRMATDPPRRISTLGILGPGRLGTVLARLAVSAGLRVLVARSGDPAIVAPAMNAIGATAASTATVIAESDAVILALPLGEYRMLPAGLLRGALVIDAMNYWWASDGIRE